MRREILTSSGVYFNFDDLNVWDIDIEDIAYSLAGICRYTAHCRRPTWWWPFRHYSVAQHCVLASYICPPEHSLDVLMHDIAEALLGDVAAPVKQMLPDYKRIEHRVERALYGRFSLPFPPHPEIKRADMRMLMTEKRDIMHKNAGKWTREDEFPAADFRVLPWPAWYAKYRFLKRYRQLRALDDMSLPFDTDVYLGATK